MKRLAFFKLIFFVSLTLISIYLLNRKIGDIPPLGKFLNPATGFWQNAESVVPRDIFLEDGALLDEVTILIDDQGVPHIFAQNDHDLYFAQGYITAKDRLWQLDFQTRYAAGRLSEVVGKKAVELDRYQRRIGMTYGAENMITEATKDTQSKAILEAYAAGINAYINQLEPADYPIEFKILDYEPELWKPLNSALLLKLMSATLARGTNELALSNILDQYEEEVINDLFPNYPFVEDPIIPQGTPWDFDTDSSSTITNAAKIATVKKDHASRTNSEPMNWLTSRLLTAPKPENLGSNNWTVNGNKSSTGFPILANDPHLDLTLPSIWYQIQLQSPHVNVYGASIPGAPNVIIGFNENIAWGVTNVGSDVLDWYQVTFKDSSHQEYKQNDHWRKTKTRIEEIKVRGQQAFYDTVYYTHQGPIPYLDNKPEGLPMTANIPEGYALNWVAHLPSNEIKTFFELNMASDYEDYRHALSHFVAPAQNFVYADRKGDIAITPNGLFPLKENRQGKFLLDGSDSANEWKQRIPFERNPTARNPDQNYLSSANQWPVDPSYPYYLGWEFAPSERARRINSQLEKMEEASLRSFQALQTDDYSLLAEALTDTLLHILADASNLSDLENRSLAELKDWNYRYEHNSVAASIFETFYNKINDQLWKEYFSNQETLMRYPSRDRTLHLLLHEPESRWYSTPGKERTRSEVVVLSFKESIQELKENYGSIEHWEWGHVKQTHVPHLAAIPGLGSTILDVGGSKHTVNAMSEKNGPSWRMVILLGNQPKAYGVLPGGASGNPGSPFYDNQISTWEKGELIELHLLDTPSRDQENIISQIKLTPSN